jgi:protein-S-isoprenylcysteine O-methyltransferase Ste14
LAEAELNEMMKRVLPPTYFLIAILVAICLHLFIPLRQLLVFPWRLVGVLPLLAGIVLNLVADQSFKKRNTTVKPFEKSSALVTDRVFGFSRNPMYLGMTLILLGVALLLGSLTPLAVVIALPVLLDRLFIVPEERMLEASFGDEFRRYRQRVRRWV